MNRATLGLSAILFSFLCLAVMGFARNDSAASDQNRLVVPKLSPTMTLIPKKDNPSDPTPSPYRNPSDPKPTPSPYKNPSDPTPTPNRNPSDPTPTPKKTN